MIETNSNIIFEKKDAKVLEIELEKLESFREALNYLVNVKSNYSLIHSINTEYGENKIIVVCDKKKLEESNLKRTLESYGALSVTDSVAYVISKDDLENVLSNEGEDSASYIFLE